MTAGKATGPTAQPMSIESRLKCHAPDTPFPSPFAFLAVHARAKVVEGGLAVGAEAGVKTAVGVVACDGEAGR
jgi:hypothetical protein